MKTITADQRLLSDFDKIPKIMITGTPRSGTTMINSELVNGYHEIISECCLVRSLLHQCVQFSKVAPLNILAYMESDKQLFQGLFRNAMNSLLSYAWKKCSKPKDFVVFKEPHLSQDSKYFDQIFDDSWKVIYMIRDPRAVMSSWMKVREQLFFSDKKNNISNKVKIFFKRKEIFKNECGYILHLQKNIYNMYKNSDKNKYYFCKYEDYVSGKKVEELNKFLGRKITAITKDTAFTAGSTLNKEYRSEDHGKPVLNLNI